MGQSVIQVDAFTTTPFSGNPAAVCVLSAPQSDDWMQNVAQEMNLSETAFLSPQTDGFNLRWFTPTVEVPLCGHATLASAHVLWTEGHLPANQSAKFHTQSGVLTAARQGDWIELNFPVSHAQPTTPVPQLHQALGIGPDDIKSVLQDSLGYLVEVVSEELVRHMQPDFGLMGQLPAPDVIVTSVAKANSEFDFVSRFFAPSLGIFEDPVTGAAHCRLAPYWRDRLGQDHFLAYQASHRGGVVKVCYDGGDRVLLAGQAVTVLKGELI